MIVVGDVDFATRWHLVRALLEENGRCRADGIPLPADLDALLDHLSDTAGHSRTSVAPRASIADASFMILAVDYETAGVVLSVSAKTVQRLVASGALPAVTIAGCRRIRRADLVEFAKHLGAA